MATISVRGKTARSAPAGWFSSAATCRSIRSRRASPAAWPDRRRAMASNPRFELAGRTVIVTGGGKGIGRVYAQEFARAGARVVVCDIDEAAAICTAEALAAEGLEALGLGTDIANEQSVAAMAKATLDRFGTIDVLINNASLMSVLPRRSW